MVRFLSEKGINYIVWCVFTIFDNIREALILHRTFILYLYSTFFKITIHAMEIGFEAYSKSYFPFSYYHNFRNLTNSSLYRSHQSLDATSLDKILYSTLFLPDSDIRCIQVTTPRKRIILARKLRKDHKNDMKVRSHFPEYFFCLKKFQVQQGTQFGNSWFQE